MPTPWGDVASPNVLTCFSKHEPVEDLSGSSRKHEVWMGKSIKDVSLLRVHRRVRNACLDAEVSWNQPGSLTLPEQKIDRTTTPPHATNWPAPKTTGS